MLSDIFITAPVAAQGQECDDQAQRLRRRPRAPKSGTLKERRKPVEAGGQYHKRADKRQQPGDKPVGKRREQPGAKDIDADEQACGQRNEIALERNVEELGVLLKEYADQLFAEDIKQDHQYRAEDQRPYDALLEYPLSFLGIAVPVMMGNTGSTAEVSPINTAMMNCFRFMPLRPARRRREYGRIR